MEETENIQLQFAFDFVQNTGRNIFLTGKAGTGKTTFLHNLRKTSHKRMIVVAPTGVAAINAAGVTIHSFFQLPFAPFIPKEVQPEIQQPHEGEKASESYIHKFSRDKISIMKSLDLLVIDEISMVRADVLDAVDDVLRRYRDRNKPFGGVQLLLIGDLHQLAPVVKEDEWRLLNEYYQTMFFFSSLALQKTGYVSIELKHIYRQSDDFFIDLLGSVRNNKMNAETFQKLNSRHIPNFVPVDGDGYITLTTHNYQANNINEAKLKTLKAKAETFEAIIDGDFPEYSYPTAKELVIKIGAQVMFVKNDISREKLYYNGKIGKVVGIEEEEIIVHCQGDFADIHVGMVEWENMKYEIDYATKNINENKIGSFTQYPLKLAWAITIHKSQGLTFDKAIIDAQEAFASGQVYVALSRCRTFEGLVLSRPITQQALKSDLVISSFTNNIEQNPPGKQLLIDSKRDYQLRLLLELFDFNSSQRRLGFILKLLKEHAGSIDPDLVFIFDKLNSSLKAEMAEVAEKFKNQLLQLIQQHDNAEENVVLQDRVKKASVYFADKTDNILYKAIMNIVIESDNKVVRKTITDALEHLREEAWVKLCCLKNSIEGFKVHEFLEVRAKAAITKPEMKKTKAVVDSPVSTSKDHPKLYQKLNNWRKTIAEEENVPIFFVLPQKTMMELMEQQPCTPAALKKINGFGKKKAQKWGAVVLEMIIDYRKENDLEIEEPKIEYDPPKKEKIPNSKQLSYDLYKAGKTPDEIAAERGMAISTIQGHLANFVLKGELKIEEFLLPEKIERITNYFLEKDDYSLSPAKISLGNDVSYDELRLVLNHLRFQKKIEFKTLND